jgi:hypothetical protein
MGDNFNVFSETSNVEQISVIRLNKGDNLNVFLETSKQVVSVIRLLYKNNNNN